MPSGWKQNGKITLPNLQCILVLHFLPGIARGLYVCSNTGGKPYLNDSDMLQAYLNYIKTQLSEQCPWSVGAILAES